MKSLTRLLSILILLAAIVCSSELQAQTKSALILKKRDHSDSTGISSGSLSLIFSQVITKKGKKYSGKMTLLNEDQVVVKNDTINISEIERIRVRRITPLVVGGVLAVTGATFASSVSSLIFLALLPQVNLQLTFLNPFTLSGVGLAGAGTLMTLLRRTYTSYEWNMFIEEY